MARLALAAFVLVVAVLALGRTAAAADAKTVDLYTIGPGDYLFSRYGHSLLCVRDGDAAPEAPAGRCFDYGIPDRDEVVHMAWTSIRGQPSFVPLMIEERLVLDVYRGQGRAIERQRLPLSAEEAERLASRLEEDARERRAYAYHPYWSNCSTQLRDRIDEATGGRLRPGRSTPATARFREIAEEGLSGRLGELTMLAFLLGAPNDRVPDGWEVMFIPTGLRDGVLERLGASVETVSEHQAIVLPTSRAVGRAALVLLAFALFALVRFAIRRGRARAGLILLGLVLGSLGALTVLVASLVVWPELSNNWSLALLVPTDLALPLLPRRWLVAYARARIAIAVALGVLELVGVIAQPILPIVALVAIPLAGMLGALRAAEEDDTGGKSADRGDTRTAAAA